MIDKMEDDVINPFQYVKIKRTEEKEDRKASGQTAWARVRRWIRGGKTGNQN